MAGSLRYSLIGDASSFQSAAQEASQAAEMVEADMEGLQDAARQAALGQLEYNDAAEQFVNTSGDFVSQQRAQAELFERLRSVGVKTEEMYTRQIQELNQLAGAVEEGSVEHRQLMQMQDRLQREMVQTGEAAEQASMGMGGTTELATDLGFVLQDLQSFQFGVSQGFIAISNNVGPMVAQVARANTSLSGMAAQLANPTTGLIVGVNALAAALPILVDQFTATEGAAQSAREEANKAVEDFQRLADQAIQIGGREELDFRIPAEQLPEAVSNIEGRIQALQEIQGAIPEAGGLIPAREFEQLGPRAREIVQSINAQNDSLILQEDLVTSRLDAAQGLLETLKEQRATQQEREQLLRELGIVAGDNQSTASQTAEELAKQRQEVADLEAQFDSLLTATGIRLAEETRTKEQLEAQVEALRNANRLVALQREGMDFGQIMPAGVDGQVQTPQVLQDIQALSGQSNLMQQYARQLEEAAVNAGALARNLQRVELAGSPRELGRGMEEDADAAGAAINQGVNQQLAQGIQLASQLGTTLVQSAQQGGLSFQQAFSSILTTVGSIIGFTNPAAGAAIAGSGQLIGAFRHGGEVNTPLQIVGEEGPELAALPQGSQVASNQEMEAMLASVMQDVMGGQMFAMQQLARTTSDGEMLTRNSTSEPAPETRSFLTNPSGACLRFTTK